MVPPPPKGFLPGDQELVLSIFRENLCVPTVLGISRPREPPGTGEDIVTTRQPVIFLNILYGGAAATGHSPGSVLFKRSISQIRLPARFL
jgi:hypothetical protein